MHALIKLVIILAGMWLLLWLVLETAGVALTLILLAVAIFVGWALWKRGTRKAEL